MYNVCCTMVFMGRKEVEQKLAAMGWTFVGPASDARYDTWTKSGRTIVVPRHDILNDYTADRILQDAER